MTISRSKYHNKKISTASGTFDSQKEYKRWLDLLEMQRAGLITGLARQQRYELIPKINGQRATYYVADFCYIENGDLVVEDCKGYRTEVYKLKKKLMKWRYGIDIKET